MSRSVTVHLSEFVCSVVAGEGEEGREHLPERVVEAIRCYLGDSDSYGPGWAYPRFVADEEPREEVALQLEIDEELWTMLEEEAERQGVSSQKMVAHAALYVAGEADAGRTTRRILNDLKKGSATEKRAEGSGLKQPAAPPQARHQAR